jgi:alpha-glucoside transport system substrate-binding protein
LYGAPYEVNLKSLVWYPVPEFHKAGYTVPETWDELVALTEQMIADGRTPWCMGLESGDATGWPATDWIENLLLGEAGPSLYDQWTTHGIPMDDPAVRRAFERFGDIVFQDGSLASGAEGATLTHFDSAQLPMTLQNPPGCWLYHFPSFATDSLPDGSVGRTVDAFPFPPPNARQEGVMLGGAGWAVALSDRPEVREVVRFLLSPDFGARFSAGDGKLSPNRRFDKALYDPFWRRYAELLDAALVADTFRFDGSDFMPVEVGTNRFWDAMTRYMVEGPESLDAILADLEAAWPDDDG